MLARSNSRLFYPVSGRTMVINLINEIRLIEWDYLKRRFNWVYVQEIHRGDLRAAIEVLADWEKETRSSYYAWFVSSLPFSAPLDEYYINNLRHLYQISKNIEDKLNQLNQALKHLKNCIGDTEQFENHRRKVKNARRDLIVEIGIQFKVINYKRTVLRDEDSITKDMSSFKLNNPKYLPSDNSKINDLCNSKFNEICKSEIIAIYRYGMGNDDEILYNTRLNFTYDIEDGKQREFRVTNFYENDKYDALSSTLKKEIKKRVLYGEYQLDKIAKYLKAEINAEIADYQKLSDHLVQKVHDTVTPVKSENIRLTTEFLHKDYELSAAKTKIKLLTEESEKSQKYAATLANDQLFKQREADNDAVNKHTSLMSDNPPSLRSRRK